MLDSTLTPDRAMAKLLQVKTYYMICVLSVFSTPANYGVVMITRSSSEVVLQTLKHTMIYPCLGPSSKVLARRPVV
jgi:hypothetical protein